MREQVVVLGRAALQRLFYVILFLGCVKIAAARSDWIFDFRSGVLYDSNVSHSDRAADVEEDLAWRSEIRAGQGFQLTDDLRFGIFANVEGQAWSTYSGLSNVRPGLDTSLRYRFGLGRNAPWIRLRTNVAYADFQEARRSGLDFRPGFSAGFGLTDRIRLDAGYEYEHFGARDTVFEQTAHSFAIHGTIDFTSSLQVVGGYVFRDGDVTSAALPPRAELVAIADARELINTFDETYTAYRFPASSHTLSLGISQALNSYVAIQASYHFQRTRHAPVTYTNHVAELGLAFTF